MLQNTLQRANQAPSGRQAVQAWVRLWQKMGIRSVRQAWGLAPDERSWALVCLSRAGPDLVRVHTSTLLRPPSADIDEAPWLSEALQDAHRGVGRGRHPLAMAVAAANAASGSLACPVEWAEEVWSAEVQLEVAKALNLPTDEVNFDFQLDAGDSGPIRRLRWVGCAKSLINDYQHWTSEAGWHLSRVEPVWAAAERAARALVGGLPSLLRQAPQDWQFRLHPRLEPHALTPEVAFDGRQDAQLQEALASAAGPRLVAAGLALKAWT